MTQKFKVLILALFTVLGIGVAVTPASATITPNNVVSGADCSGTQDHVAWTNTAGLKYARGGFCISNPRNGGARLVFQKDGNLVLYSGAHSGGRALWATGTNENYGEWLNFQTDGNIVIRNCCGDVRWNMKTGKTGRTGVYRLFADQDFIEETLNNNLLRMIAVM